MYKLCYTTALIIMFLIQLTFDAEAQLVDSLNAKGYDLKYDGRYYTADIDSLIYNGSSLKSDSILRMKIESSVDLAIKDSKLRTIVLEPSNKYYFPTDQERGFIYIEDTDFTNWLVIRDINNSYIQFEGKAKGVEIQSSNSLVSVSSQELNEMFLMSVYHRKSSNDWEQKEQGGYVVLSDLTLTGPGLVEGYIDSIWVRDIRLEKEASLKIRSLKPLLIKLRNNVDMSKLDFNYNQIEFNLTKEVNIHLFYKKLKEMQQSNGYQEGFKKADIEYKKVLLKQKSIFHKYVISNLAKYWNNYGYSKHLIIQNTLILFTIFAVINWLMLYLIVYEVYPLDSLSDYKQKLTKFKFSNTPYAIYFTAVVFFGLRMDIKILKLDRKLLVLYLFLQYLSGVVCLAFLANYILGS